MRARSLISILLLCLLKSGMAMGAQYRMGLVGYGVSDGLPNNWVKKVLQDTKGYIWVSTNDGLCRFDGTSFNVPSFISCIGELSQNISDIYIDEDDVLWVSTEESLLYVNLGTYESGVLRNGIRASSLARDNHGNLWCVSSGVAMRYGADHVWKQYEGFSCIRLCSSPKGQIWVTASDGRVMHYEPSDDSFRPLPLHCDVYCSADFNQISSIDERTILLVSSDNRAYVLDAATGKATKIFDGKIDAAGALILALQCIAPGEYLIATDDGLYHYRSGSSVSRLSFGLPGGHPLSNNLRCIFMDSEGRVWIGTFFDGLYCSYPSDMAFYTKSPSIIHGSLKGEVVRAMCEDKVGNIWAATEDGTLEKISPDGSVTSYTSDDGFPVNANFQSIGYVNGHIFVGSYGMGLFDFDPVHGSISRRYDVGSNRCTSILCTRDGTVYAGVTDGLYQLKEDGSGFFKLDSVGSGFVHALCQDSKGNVWVGFYRGGVTRYNPLYRDVVSIAPHGAGYSLGNKRVTDIMESLDGKIWVTTTGDGVFVINPEVSADGTFDVMHLDKQDGLPSNIACSVVEDMSGIIWVTTEGGVVMIRDGKDVVKVPDFSRELNQFRYGSALKSTSGRICLGTTRGVLSYDPGAFVSMDHHLDIADVYRTTDGVDYPLDVAGPITISYSDASLTIRLASAMQNLDEVCQFEYSLSSRNTKRNASSVSSNNFITYVNLAPGSYVFRARVSGDVPSVEGVTRIITIRPPFYASVFAYLVYTLASMVLLVLLVMHFRRKYRSEMARKTELLDIEKQKEIYESKLEFFTNVSHEIRTPLTLIKIPVEKMLSRRSYPKDMEEDMMIVKSNTDKLLEQVNQLLDLRKYEGNRRELSFSDVDLTELTGAACREFKRIAESIGLEFRYSIPETPVIVSCSRSSVDKILHNLFMNGVKYCSSFVNVSLVVGDGKVDVVVDSDGMMIPLNEREKIFEPFYQSKNRLSNISSAKGTGIGLALSRSLAVMNGGDIILDGTRTDLNSFIFTLPAKQSVKEETVPVPSTLADTSFKDEDAQDRFSILIVEDDAALNRLLTKELSDEYHVLHCSNGKEAIEILKKVPVGLVISDVVMPEMDGCALCNHIKSNVEFSHIPVVLMTAMTDSEVQLSSLQSGADYYLPKPFSMDVLKASIFNILKNREIITKQFSSKPFNMEVATYGAKDEEFMAKLNSVIMDNLSDPQYSVFDLADQMSVSRSTLFRKVKANTGQNVNEYIKICRLKKATELLASNKYMIKEISYMVGFSSSSYFAKEFKNQFGISPSSIISNADGEE